MGKFALLRYLSESGLGFRRLDSRKLKVESLRRTGVCIYEDGDGSEIDCRRK